MLHATYVTQTFPNHTHDRFAVGIIERGALEFHYRGANIVAASGEINLCLPGELHDGHAMQSEGWTYRMLYFDPAIWQQIASEVANRTLGFPFFQSGVIRDEVLAQTIRRLHIKLTDTGQDLLDQDITLVNTIAQMILRHAENPPKIKPVRKDPHVISLIKDYMQTHYASHISLADLCRLTNISRFHLVHMFKQYVGLPPQTYLRQIRLQHAKDLLVKGETIAQAALATGFSDQSHLTRWFKRVWGYTPGLYSNLIQDN